MIYSRRMKKIKIIVLTCFISLTLLGIIFNFFFFPGLVKNTLLKATIDLGFSNPNLQVRQVTPYKLDIRNFNAGPLKKPSFKIPSISIDLSLLSLWKKQIQSIKISGASLVLDYKDNILSIKGLNFPKDTSKTSQSEWAFHNITIDSSQIQLNIAGKILYIPFHGTIKQKNSQGHFFLDFSLILFGDKIYFKADLDLNKNKGKISFLSLSLHLQNLSRIFDRPLPFLFRGKADLNTQILFKEGKLSSATLSLKTRDFYIIHEDGQVKGSTKIKAEFSKNFNLSNLSIETTITKAKYREFVIKKPFKLLIKSSDLKSFDFHLSSFTFTDSILSKKIEPTHSLADFHKIKGKVLLGEEHWSIIGDYNCSFNMKALQSWFQKENSLLLNSLPDLFNLTGSFSSGLDKTGLLWEIQGKGNRGLDLLLGNYLVKTKNCSLSVYARGKGNVIKARVNLKARQLAAKWASDLGKNKLTAAQVQVQSRLEYDPATGKKRAYAHIRLVSTTFFEENGLEAKGINLDTSIVWPPVKGHVATPGSFNIGSMVFAGTQVNSISGTLGQKGETFIFSGQAPLPVKPLALDFSGSAKITDKGPVILLDINVPLTKLPPETSLDSLHPLLAGIKATGKFAFSARLFPDSIIRGMLKINEASLSFPESKIFLEGVESEIRFKDLARFISEPGLSLRFKKLSFGDIPLTDGELVFTLEDGDSVFFERGVFNWCRGRLHANSFRYFFDENRENEFKLILYCNKINFNDMINTLMGKEMTSGSGEISGIIPLRINKGVPVFEKGFLYSTPGEKGNIAVTESHLISGGVLLVEEAIKDFLYESIKVSLDTVDNNLNMTVFINGTPNRILPLVYNNKKKDFIRIESGKSGVKLKGLNLRLRFIDIDLKTLFKENGGFQFLSDKK